MGKRATCSADKGWSIGIRQRAKGTPKKFSVGIFKLSVSTGLPKPHALAYCVIAYRGIVLLGLTLCRAPTRKLPPDTYYDISEVVNTQIKPAKLNDDHKQNMVSALTS
jgi:hypothetical protein